VSGQTSRWDDQGPALELEARVTGSAELGMQREPAVAGAGPGRFRDRITSQADGAARMYLAGRENGQPDTLEVKRVIEMILSPSYDGRTVIELLQNGHDAHAEDVEDGLLEFVLVEGDGPHGALYVANGGLPLLDKDFTSLCRVGMSSKRPDQAIGHKGVGFKSVLNLTEAPEVYSKAAADSTGFDGYCFRFATGLDYENIAERLLPDDAGLAEALRQNVAGLKLPVHLSAVPAAVQRFADRAVTVVRLPLRDASAYAREHVSSWRSCSRRTCH